MENLTWCIYLLIRQLNYTLFYNDVSSYRWFQMVYYQTRRVELNTRFLFFFSCACSLDDVMGLIVSVEIPNAVIIELKFWRPTQYFVEDRDNFISSIAVLMDSRKNYRFSIHQELFLSGTFPDKPHVVYQVLWVPIEKMLIHNGGSGICIHLASDLSRTTACRWWYNEVQVLLFCWINYLYGAHFRNSYILVTLKY